jgi:Ca2+-transporting ATPase
MSNPKSHNAFYELGGLVGLEKGLKTDRNAGLSVNETTFDESVAYEDVAARDTPKYGTAGDKLPEPKTPTSIPPATYDTKASGFLDRRRIFSENRLPDKKNKTLLQLAWQTYNDKVLILLTIAAVVSLALGLYQTFGGALEEGEVGVVWIEGVAILVAIAIVVIVGTLNDCKLAYTCCMQGNF